MSDRELYHIGKVYVSAKPGGEATLEGRFTLGEIEAIAQWMRDPASVAKAYEALPHHHES